MCFNYGKEKRKFEAEWAKTAAWYEREGMDKDAIEEMRRFDWELFCKDRTFANRMQALPNEMMDDDGRSMLFKKFESLSVAFEEDTFSGRFDWIQSIDDQRLVCKLKRLSDEDLELLTLLVIYDQTQCELAARLDITQQAVSKQILRLKKFFNNF